MIFTLKQTGTQLSRLNELPTIFFERVDANDTFGNHLFPDWFPEVCGGHHGLIRKFSDLFTFYKSTTDEIREQLQLAYKANNLVKDQCSNETAQIEIKKGVFSNELQTLLSDVFTHLYNQTLENPVFESWAETTVTDFIDDFSEENGINICPFCGLHGYTPMEGEARLALDHWMCKEHFPQASVNFDNLVPICEKCNKAPVKTDKIITHYPAINPRTKSLYPYIDHNGIVISFSFIKEPDTAEFRHVPFTLTIAPKNIADQEIFDCWMAVFNIQKRFEAFMKNGVYKVWNSEVRDHIRNNGIQTPTSVIQMRTIIISYNNNIYLTSTLGARLFHTFNNYLVGTSDEYIESLRLNIIEEL